MSKERRGNKKWESREPGKLDLATLRALCQRKESCVEQVKKVVHLALPFCSLKDVMGGVHAELGHHVNRYYPSIGGILLGYARPQLTASTGNLLRDQAFVHLDVAADFFMFSPSLGKVLTGTVVKRSAGHLGCLLHSTFNISMRAGRDDITVVEGDDVRIEVTKMDYGSGRSLPNFEGKLVRGDVEYDSGISSPDALLSSGEKRIRETETEEADEPRKKKAKIVNEEIPNHATDNASFELNGSKQKKKKNKEKDQEAVLEVKIEPHASLSHENSIEGTTISPNFVEVKEQLLSNEFIEERESSTKKKKKKKSKDRLEISPVKSELRVSEEYVEPEDVKSDMDSSLNWSSMNNSLETNGSSSFSKKKKKKKSKMNEN